MQQASGSSGRTPQARESLYRQNLACQSLSVAGPSVDRKPDGAPMRRPVSARVNACAGTERYQGFGIDPGAPPKLGRSTVERQRNQDPILRCFYASNSGKAFLGGKQAQSLQRDLNQSSLKPSFVRDHAVEESFILHGH